MKGIWCCLYICLSYQFLIGQNEERRFDQVNLTKVLKKFENKTDYIFNYDPSLLAEFEFTGSVDLNNPKKVISKILYDTPFEFEFNHKTILIYEPAPQKYRICGHLQDDVFDEVLIGANIYADNTNTGTQTAVNGFFDFTIEAFKNQKISMSYLGYRTRSIMVQDLSESCSYYTLSIDKNMWEGEILVKDYKLNKISQDKIYGGYQLNYHQLSKNQPFAENDILKSIQHLPGISSLDESASNLQIRGSSRDQNLILWEGAPIYNSGHFFGMISAINPFSLDKVNVFKGAYDPKYANRVGGIVDISLPDTISTSFHGSTGVTLTEAHMNLEIPVLKDKLFFIISGRHSLNTLYQAPPLQNYATRVFQFSKIDDFTEDSELGNVDSDQMIEFYDLNAKVMIKPSEKLFFSASVYKNNQRFQYDFSLLDDPYGTSDRMAVNTSAASANLDWKPSNFWTSTLSFQQSTYNNAYDFEGKELDNFLIDYEQFNSIFDQSLSIIQRYESSFKLIIESGYEYNIKKVNYEFVKNDFNEPFQEDRSFEEGQFHNIFSSLNYTNNQWSVSGGIRSTYYTELKKWVASPRISLQYSVSNELKLKVQSGIFHQFVNQLPEFGFNDVEANNPFWVLNISEYRPSQKVKKISAGFAYQKKGWLVDVEAYHNYTIGLSTLAPLHDLIIVDGFASGSSVAKGLDILIKKRWNNFHCWVNYSLGKVTYLFPDISGDPFYAPHDIRHNLSLVSSYVYKDFQLSLNGAARSGLPFTRPQGISDYYDVDDDITYYFLDLGELNKDRLKSYFRFDLSFSYKPTFKKLKNLRAEFTGSLINIFNRENAFFREYGISRTELNGLPKIRFVERVLPLRTPLITVRFYW